MSDKAHDDAALAEGQFEEFAAAFRAPGVAHRLQQAAPGIYAAAARFWRSAHTAPTLSPRMRELVLVALHGTVTSLHGVGVRRHIRRALAAGATEQDVLDVLITIVGAANHALYFALPVLMREMEQMGHPDAALPPPTAEALAIKEEFIRARGFWNTQRDTIVQLMPDYFAALSQLSTEPWKHGTLTDRERELVCIAIDCTVTHMFEPGLAIHVRNALQKGASRVEILEVFQLASVLGLEGYMLAAETLYATPAGDAAGS